MAREIIQMYDKYHSTKKVYPKVIEECLPEGIVGVDANPTLAGTEAELTGLEVGGTKYKVTTPTTVVANPELAGTEGDLEGLQVGDTKYKIGGGKQLYRHIFKFSSSTDKYTILTEVINDVSTEMTMEDFATYIRGKGFNTSSKLYPCCGCQTVGSLINVYFGFYADSNYYPIGICKKSDGSDSAGAMGNATFSDTVIAL